MQRSSSGTLNRRAVCVGGRVFQRGRFCTVPLNVVHSWLYFWLVKIPQIWLTWMELLQTCGCCLLMRAEEEPCKSVSDKWREAVSAGGLSCRTLRFEFELLFCSFCSSFVTPGVLIMAGCVGGKLDVTTKYHYVFILLRLGLFILRDKYRDRWRVQKSVQWVDAYLKNGEFCVILCGELSLVRSGLEVEC